ncbi:hypothetical protein PHJA_000754500 [Phtheirospermum japonicum]|uniref:OCEL domain-containing protein n=1 Tax=Phtheirospermum japonicum TaxID=374723 RepID=A0A830BGT5_9LAMI|nr:hypothetical protein PHJA_000754500 [Phtheirospermum japonicum]
MFGSSGKMGRGGGAGAGKRNLHAPPINRTGRPSMGGGPRGRGGAPSSAISSPSTSSMQVEESFSLVRENPLSFGMAIKLAPDLVEEIKRVEAQGIGARIKFDVNANNPNGNVIQVGDKIFKFTWSREPGDLCDVYEERQSGEDGNGLLVESGGTWRKLNVERELDESTKNHVKRRSEEAERKHKSRKAIVLDHQNPSMKTQVKAIAASESNPWRNKNRKEPPFKKAKLDPPSGGPPKPAYNKPGLSTTTLSKGKISSVSPLSFQPDQHGAPVSPLGSGIRVKGHGDVTDVAPTHTPNNIANSDKEMHSRLPHSTNRDKPKHNRNTEAKPADLRSLVTSLLQEYHPKGMSLKALEKAIGEVMPNSARQIDPILKQVAVFQAPGRYFLKSAVEKESSKRPPSQSGSSPETNRHQSPSPQKFNQPPAQDASFFTRTPANIEEEEQGELNSTPLHATDKLDILQNSPQQLSEKKVPDNGEGLPASSSDTGSDSDSDSSDSDSDSESHSRSKSRSPVGSSSDSDSDASISSKQASDEDVDIMSDDDNESKHKLLEPVQLSNPDDESVDIGTYDEKLDDHITDVVEIEKDSPEDDRANCLFSNNKGEEHVEEIRPPSVDHRQSDSVVNESFPKVKSKRHRDDKRSDETTHSKKRVKSKNLSQPVSGTLNSLFGDSPDQSSPDRPLQGPEKGWDGNNEARVLTEAPSGDKRPGKHDGSDRSAKYSERNLQTNEGPRVQKGFNAEAHSEGGSVSERRPVKSSSEGVADKHATMLESHYRKSETSGKVKEAGPYSSSHVGNSPKENNNNNNASITDRLPVTNGRGIVLRREYSDLELGEFREPVQEVTPLPKKKQIERKNSFKQMENKPMDPECRNSDPSRGKPPNNKMPADLGVKLSSPNPETKASENKSTHIEGGSQHNKVLEMSSKSRFADSGLGRARSSEAHGDISRRMPVNSTEQQHDPVRGVGPNTTKGSKKQKPNVVGDSNGRRIDASLTGSYDGGQIRKESLSDENSGLYIKYEKEEPELKGPIKDASQYKEYVKEYQEKYESYCSLNKILESYRDEFSKLGKDLEAYKGRDMKRYHDTLKQMRTSFHQCGELMKAENLLDPSGSKFFSLV